MTECTIIQTSSTSRSSATAEEYDLGRSWVYPAYGSVSFGAAVKDQPNTACIQLIPTAIGGASNTFATYPNVFTRQYQSNSQDFEAVVASFYATLLAKQQPLGEDFENVIAEHLWDLYIEN
jgi:hypothetical protein